jgi:hypothetical protein
MKVAAAAKSCRARAPAPMAGAQPRTMEFACCRRLRLPTGHYLALTIWPLSCRDPLFEGHVACEPELPAVICTSNCREIEYSKMLL